MLCDEYLFHYGSIKDICGDLRLVINPRLNRKRMETENPVEMISRA